MEFPGLFSACGYKPDSQNARTGDKRKENGKNWTVGKHAGSKKCDKNVLVFWYDREKTGGGDYGE